MERNHKEDQSNEIEALESIYFDDIEMLLTDPLHKFKIRIYTSDYDVEKEDNGISCHLVFTFTEKYPDTGPLVEIEDPTNFEDTHTRELLDHIKEIISDNLGTEMVFSIVIAAQEWMNERWDEHKRVEEDRLLAKERVREEEERKKFEGTRVTVESFLAWRTQFELETGIAQRREKIGENKKPTGKELFLKDNTLNESDLKFLLEAGESLENVKIDESLFQNIDDLELDSDTDDSDYVPGKDFD